MSSITPDELNSHRKQDPLQDWQGQAFYPGAGSLVGLASTSTAMSSRQLHPPPDIYPAKTMHQRVRDDDIGGLMSHLDKLSVADQQIPVALQQRGAPSIYHYDHAHDLVSPAVATSHPCYQYQSVNQRQRQAHLKGRNISHPASTSLDFSSPGVAKSPLTFSPSLDCPNSYHNQNHSQMSRLHHNVPKYVSWSGPSYAMSHAHYLQTQIPASIDTWNLQQQSTQQQHLQHSEEPPMQPDQQQMNQAAKYPSPLGHREQSDRSKLTEMQDPFTSSWTSGLDYTDGSQLRHDENYRSFSSDAHCLPPFQPGADDLAQIYYSNSTAGRWTQFHSPQYMSASNVAAFHDVNLESPLQATSTLAPVCSPRFSVVDDVNSHGSDAYDAFSTDSRKLSQRSQVSATHSHWLSFPGTEPVLFAPPYAFVPSTDNFPSSGYFRTYHAESTASRMQQNVVTPPNAPTRARSQSSDPHILTPKSPLLNMPRSNSAVISTKKCSATTTGGMVVANECMETESVAYWLRTLKLHKYKENFRRLSFDTVCRFSDADLENHGVATVGARTKLLGAIHFNAQAFEKIRNLKEAVSAVGNKIVQLQNNLDAVLEFLFRYTEQSRSSGILPDILRVIVDTSSTVFQIVLKAESSQTVMADLYVKFANQLIGYGNEFFGDANFFRIATDRSQVLEAVPSLPKNHLAILSTQFWPPPFPSKPKKGPRDLVQRRSRDTDGFSSNRTSTAPGYRTKYAIPPAGARSSSFLSPHLPRSLSDGSPVTLSPDGGSSPSIHSPLASIFPRSLSDGPSVPRPSLPPSLPVPRSTQEKVSANQPVATMDPATRVEQLTSLSPGSKRAWSNVAALAAPVTSQHPGSPAKPSLCVDRGVRSVTSAPPGTSAV